MAWLGTYVQTQHDDFEAVEGQGEIDLVHDQDLAVSEARLALDVAFTKQLGASLVVPVRMVDSSIRYLDRAGNEVELVTPGIHHRNETLVGIADPMLLGSFTTPIGPARAVIRAGFTLPLGRTEENPFSAEAQTMEHQHVQFGSGTINPVVAADLSWTNGKWRFGGFALTQQGIYENDRGYKVGDRYAGGIVIGRRLGTKWSLRGGLEVQAETAEHWNGTVHTDDGNRGRFDAMFAAGGSYAASDRLAFDFTVKVPFITEAVGGQLEMPAIVEVGAAWRFGKQPKKSAKEEDHDHEDHDHAHGDEHAHGEEHGDEHAHGDKHDDEHAHGDKHDPDETSGATNPDNTSGATNPDTKTGSDPISQTGEKTEPAKTGSDPISQTGEKTEPGKTGSDPISKKPPPIAKKPDIADVGKPGEAPDLVPVRGKLTIFDFWATWCKPCKTLDAALVELAKKHPDLVAIRKLDVVDFDSATAKRYLNAGGFDLPHLKIYDPSGRRVLEKSSKVGKLEELIAETKAIVEAEAKKRPVAKPAVKPITVSVKADANGFSPSAISAKVGVPVTFRFERVDAKNCASEVIFEIDGKQVEKKLEVGKVVELTLTFAKPGPVKFRCAMDMYRGTVDVR